MLALRSSTTRVSRTIAACTAVSSARALSSVAPGASRPKSSVIRCVRPVVHRRAEVVRAGHDVRDDLRVGRIGHRRLEHADDRRGARTEPDRLADHGRIAVERRRPEPVGEHRERPPPSGRRRARSSRRPSTGRRPITSKNDPLTTPALTTRGSPPRPISVKSTVEKSPKALIVLTRDFEIVDLRHREGEVLGDRGPARSGGCRSADPRRD